MDQTILKNEVSVLDDMIAQIESQLEEAKESLTKLRTVRSALNSCIDEEPTQMELELVED